MNRQLLIAAAGMGMRLGASDPKALIPLAGRPILVHTLSRFRGLELLRRSVVVVPQDAFSRFERVVAEHFPREGIRVIAGGTERQHSVRNGLEALEPSTEIVVIHDAARPFPSPAAVGSAIAAATACGAATVAVPVIDTILVGDADDWLVETPDRRRLWACQTPQVFRVEVIRAAHRRALRDDYVGTDDASLVRMNGGQVKLVRGSAENIKITTPADLAYAEHLLRTGEK